MTPVVREFVERIAAELPRKEAIVLRSLLKPRLTDGRCDCSASGGRPEPMLRNTVNATIVRGGAKINVVPSEIELELDGRALPGFAPEQLIAELQRSSARRRARARPPRPGPSEPDLGLFETLAGVIRELDPEGSRCRCSRSASPTAASSPAPACRPTASCRCGPRGLPVREADPRRRRAIPVERARVRRRGRLARVQRFH